METKETAEEMFVRYKLTINDHKDMLREIESLVVLGLGANLKAYEVYEKWLSEKKDNEIIITKSGEIIDEKMLNASRLLSPIIIRFIRDIKRLKEEINKNE